MLTIDRETLRVAGERDRGRPPKRVPDIVVRALQLRASGADYAAVVETLKREGWRSDKDVELNVNQLTALVWYWRPRVTDSDLSHEVRPQ